MAKSNTTPKSTEAPTTYTPTHCPKTGRKLTKEERRAANKAKWAKEQAALAAKRKKAKEAKAKANKPTAKKAAAPAAPAPTAKRVPVADVKRWMEQHPNRKTVSTVDITDWLAAPANTKVGKRLSRKNTLDAQMSKRNNKLEVQAQRKGGLRA